MELKSFPGFYSTGRGYFDFLSLIITFFPVHFTLHFLFFLTSFFSSFFPPILPSLFRLFRISSFSLFL